MGSYWLEDGKVRGKTTCKVENYYLRWRGKAFFRLQKTVLNEARQNNIKNICSIKVVAGEMTAVLPEALKFSFAVRSTEITRGRELLVEYFEGD